MKELYSIYEDDIKEFIRYGEYDPSDYGLSLVWMALERKYGSADVLSEAINGDELLSQDILNWVKFRDPGDQGKRRLNQALCDYAKSFVDDDEAVIWEIYENSIDTRPDPMTLAKRAEGY